MPSQRNTNRFACFRNGQLDDLNRHLADPSISGEDRLDDVISERLNQCEVQVLWDGVGDRMFQVHIIFGRSQRCIRRKCRWGTEIGRDRNAQRLGKVRFLRVNPGEHIHLDIIDFKNKAIFHPCPLNVPDSVGKLMLLFSQ